MNDFRRAVFLKAGGAIAMARDTTARFALPEPRRGRFAACACRGASAPAAYDAGRAEAVERAGVPRRYARAILF